MILTCIVELFFPFAIAMSAMDTDDVSVVLPSSTQSGLSLSLYGQALNL
jgi:hypothetical protein